MYRLIAENQYGEQIEITNNPAYVITSIDGLDPPDAVINTTHNAGMDGSEFNSAYVNSRQITITLVVNKPAEINRIGLYKYFKCKFPVRLYYENLSRKVYINGHTQNIDIGYFEKKQTIQIVVICPKPYFNGDTENIQEFVYVNPLFEFPVEFPAAGIEFSEVIQDVEQNIYNKGDVETGVVITINATGAVVNPKIYNVNTGESFILNTTLQSGDLITINTRQSEKSIKLLRSGVETNLIGALAQGSTWFQLKPDDNLFTISADSLLSNMQVTFTLIDQYEGV